MSVSTVGGSTVSEAARLQRQITADQKTLAADQKAKASQPVLDADAQRITLDTNALAQLTATSQASASVGASSSAQATASAANKVDVYL